MSIIFHQKKENMIPFLGNKNMVVVYGIKYGEILSKDPRVHIDYFCDRRADKTDMMTVAGIPVITGRQLEDIAKREQKPVTIVICVMPVVPSGTVMGIYEDITMLDIDADVFEYFGNVGFFDTTSFEYQEKTYPLFEHPFNCFTHDMRMTDRSAELSIAMEYVRDCPGELVEIGAVTPYYFESDKINVIVDPTDRHKKVTEQKSIFDIDLNGKNVLCISTIEHIGTGDYGMQEKKTSVEALEKILNESRSCMITFPYGANPLLDEWVAHHRKDSYVTLMGRGLNNEWKVLQEDDELPAKYMQPPMYAFGLVIIRK